MNKQPAAHALLISCLTFAFSLVLLFASPTSLVKAASPPTSITGNTVTGNVSSQIVPPPPGGKIYGIQGGQTAGTNLFHSFGQFNVGVGDTAQFQTSNLSPNAAISNILGRVNGQQSASQIFGTIDSATFYPSANLFLMNPYGFLFGPTATVNVGGMVAFTSADYLRLQGAGGDGIFYANPATNSVLTSAPLSAFGFLGSNPGAITVQGSQLTVTEGTGIWLIGGNITIQSGMPDNGPVQSAKLSAPGGQINLASVASPGEILAGTVTPAPNINGQSFGALGSVQIAEQSNIDVSGQTGGRISIRSGQFQIDNATLQSNTVLGDSGNIEIVSSAMSMKGGSIQTSTAGPGSAGDIAVNTRTLTMTDGAYIASVLLGEGQGGNILTNATESIAISGFLSGTTFLGPLPFTNLPSGLYTNTFSGARSGNIDVTTPKLQLQGGFFQTQTFGVGHAGNIVATVGRLDLTEGGRLASTTFADGNSGNVTLSASDSIHVSGQRQVVFAAGTVVQTNTPGQISSNTRGAGSGGQVSITTPVLDVQTGLILASTSGTGQGGTITVDVGDLSLTKGASISSNVFGDGAGGNVSINATDTVLISGRSGVTYSIGPTVFENTQSAIDTGTFGPKPSGNVTLSARNLVISDEGTIQTSSGGDGPAGTISISVGNATLATRGIIASSSGFLLGEGVFFGNGPGGEINLKADTLTASGQGTGLFSSTEAFGNGGRLNVNVSQLDLRDGAVLSASTLGPGNAGTVTVQGTGSAANSILIDGVGSGIFTTTDSTGAGGQISVTANSVTLQNGAQISSSSTGPGTAGNINVNAGNQFSMTNSTVTTEASQSGGGAIKITTNPAGTVELTNSTISASVLDGTGGGGSVDIDPQYVILQNSQILANAVFGPGGNISITTNLLLPDATSVISASSQFGQQGTITIQSPISPASGKIIPIGQRPLIPVSMVSQRCAALAGGNISSFTVAGRDTLPSEPGNWLAAPLALAAPSVGAALEARSDETDQIDQTNQTHEFPLLSLRQIGPTGFLTQAFAVESSGCQS